MALFATKGADQHALLETWFVLILNAYIMLEAHNDAESHGLTFCSLACATPASILRSSMHMYACRKQQRQDGLDCYCKACNCKMTAAPNQRKQIVVESIATSRTCQRCEQEKPADEFLHLKCRSDALHSYCRLVHAAVQVVLCICPACPPMRHESFLVNIELITPR